MPTQPSEDTIASVTEQCNKKGIDRPLAEGPDLTTTHGENNSLGSHHQRPDWANADTTDEETELPGTCRPKRGDGWWGYGPPLYIHHKGEPRPITDGAGLPSPGRWPVKRRRLPDDETARSIRTITRECLDLVIKPLSFF